MNGVKFKLTNGGLQRSRGGSDHISGLIAYGEKAVAPVELLSVGSLEKAGITYTTNPVLFYHASEFFRMCEGGKLYAMAVEQSDASFKEIKALQAFAGGNIRQVAICDFKTDNATLENSLTTIEAICNDLLGRITPLSVFYSCKIDSGELSSLVDLHTYKCPKVSVVIGQDGAGLGSKIGSNVGCVGTLLGVVAKGYVHESAAWVEKFNLVSTPYDKALTGGVVADLEFNTPAFCDGTLLKNVDMALLEDINQNGYIFLRQHSGITGTYFNDSFCAVAIDSDYAYIENNRTIAKAIREVNTVLVPKVAAPVYVDGDTGYINAATTSALEAICEEPLDAMKRAGEISDFSVNIDAEQQVLKSSKLLVQLKIVPVGTLRIIEVEIGFSIKK